MARTACYVFGAVLAAVGVWGFVQNPVLGLFDANQIHSVVHLLSGLVLLAAAMWWAETAAWALIILGVVYALVAILGFVMPGDILGLVDNTPEDNWLHTALAVVFLAVGFMGKNDAPTMGSTM